MGFDLLYAAGLLLGVPFWLWALATAPRHRHRLADRLARFPALPPAPGGRVWFHAASVGEVRALGGLVAALTRLRPDAAFVVTTQTETGWNEARRLFPEASAFKFPLDFSWIMRRALARLSPDAIVLVESEFWPNLTRLAARRGLPVCVAGGAVSDRSFARLSRAPFRVVARAVFPRLSRVWAADAAAAERFARLGTPPERIVVAGSLKCDVPQPTAAGGTEAVLRRVRAWKGNRLLLVAGSTHAGEEAALLDIVGAPGRRERLRLALAPRHPRRFEEVARLLWARGVPFQRRSALGDGEVVDSRVEVFLLDAMGELEALYREADVAFVGGSLAPVGGHNVLEPAAWGVPVLWGPHVHQFRTETEDLARAGGGAQAGDAPALARILDVWVTDPAARRAAGEAARRFVERSRGAAARLAGEIAALLPKAG